MNHLFQIVFVERPTTEYTWVTLLLFICLIILAFVFQKRNTLHDILRSFFDLRYFKQMYREESYPDNRIMTLLLVHSIIVLSLFLFYYIYPDIKHKYSISQYSFYVYIVVFIALWYNLNSFIRIAVSNLTGFSFLGKQAQIQNQIFYIAIGILSLPGVLGIYLFPHEIGGVSLRSLAENYLIFGLSSAFVFRILQSILQSFELKVSWFYIFLYLCTLEILPLCIGYQLLIGW